MKTRGRLIRHETVVEKETTARPKNHMKIYLGPKTVCIIEYQQLEPQ